MKTRHLIFILSIALAVGNTNSGRASDPARRGAYTMPYLRYESSDATTEGLVMRRSAPDFDIRLTASEATGQEFAELTAPGASIAWTVTHPANGITIRFTLPDDSSGEGCGSLLEVCVNGRPATEMSLTSRWAYQYFLRGVPQKQPASDRFALMHFDEAHRLLPISLAPGDRIELRLKEGVPTGIDFIELEKTEAPRPQPENMLSVVDFGAISSDGLDDLPAFEQCIRTAVEQHKGVYIPAGEFTLSNVLKIHENGIRLEGAGMWHTTLYFDNDAPAGGGIHADGENLYVGHLYCNTVNSTRMDNGKNRGYKCFGGTWRGRSAIEHVWEEHFTVGIWTAGYQGEKPTDGLRVSHVRLRNNYADGVNFAHGSSNCIFEYSDVRNCGDDGMASFSSNNPQRPVTANRSNTFRWCTVELVWRASGIGMFGGGGHKIYNNVISECLGSSGVRFVSDFPGHPFDPENPMEVSRCTIRKCGSRQTLYGQIYGSIELHGKGCDIVGMRFSDIDILDSQTDGIRMTGERVRDIVLSDIRIDGTGRDNRSGGKGNPAGHRGSGIFCDSGSVNPSKSGKTGACSATLRHIVCKASPDATIVNIDESYRLSCEK